MSTKTIPFSNIFLPLIETISQQVKEGRELEYSEDAIGITSLLSCPIKTELRKNIPNLESVTTVEIEDGFLWEQQVKTALKKLFGNRVKEELVLKYEHANVKIEGHLDVAIDLGDLIIGLELKSPKYLYLKRIPDEAKDIVGSTLLLNGQDFVYMPDSYTVQSKIQNYLLRYQYPGKRVYTFLFAKTLLIKGGYARKFYVLYDTNKNPFTDTDIQKLIEAYKERKGPTFAYECMMCQFFDLGICEGQTFDPIEIQYKDLDDEAKMLLKQYEQLKTELKRIETQLKKKIKGTVVLEDGRKIGWVKTKKVNIDINKAVEQIPEPVRIKYLTIKPSMQNRVAKQWPDVVRSEEEFVYWKL